MPYQLPADNGHREQLQEREVRITAQRIITGHLNPDNEDGSRFWTTPVSTGRRSWRRYGWDAWFSGATFSSYTAFRDATLDGVPFEPWELNPRNLDPLD